MEWSDVTRLIAQGEGPRIEFKETPYLKNPNDIAIAMTSLANRYGGRILFGVRDDASIEGAKIDRDKTSLSILNVAHDKCSPVIEPTFDYSSSFAGDILVVNIPRRKQIPHAMVTRKGADIYNRVYYIRSGNGKRLVNDLMLRFMFEHTGDPTIIETTPLWFWYSRKPFIFSPIQFPEYASYLLPFLQGLNNNETINDMLSSNETTIIPRLFAEILPFAFLYSLQILFSSSWIVKVVKIDGLTTISAEVTGLPGETITPQGIPVYDSELLSNIGIEKTAIMDKFHQSFQLPQGTTIELDVKSQEIVPHSHLKLTHPLFNIQIHFVSSIWSRGLPPIIDSFTMSDIDSSSNFGSCFFTMNFDSTFRFPDDEDLLFDYHYRFAQIIHQTILDKWNWNNDMNRIKEDKIQYIDDNIKKILSRVAKD